MKSIINEITARQLNVHAVKVIKDGNVLLRHIFHKDVRFPVYSATKSVLSAAFSIACDEGLISPNLFPNDFLETKYQNDVPEDFKELTFERFLTMSVSGYPFRPQGDDWLRYIFSLPVDYKAPPQFSYSNISAYIVGAALENAVGGSLYSYIERRLFEPLEIASPPFLKSPEGHFYGATGMELSIDELSRFGILYLNRGKYNGQRIISENSVNAAVSEHILKNSDGGYGYFFHTSENSFSIKGKWGQQCIIIPEKNAVITYLADLKTNTDEMKKITDAYITEEL
ncbi:MAG: serine hydrolase domain-containing protein [Ruminococcus sp.]